ncbi:MAG: hypothetical protein C4326_03480 [Ignavibacteria bacterium]
MKLALATFVLAANLLLVAPAAATLTTPQAKIVYVLPDRIRHSRRSRRTGAPMGLARLGYGCSLHAFVLPSV